MFAKDERNEEIKLDSLVAGTKKVHQGLLIKLKKNRLRIQDTTGAQGLQKDSAWRGCYRIYERRRQKKTRGIYVFFLENKYLFFDTKYTIFGTKYIIFG